MSKPLNGAVAIVTGSAMNIGREISVQLAGMGASVVAHAHTNRAGAEETADLVRSEGVGAAFWCGDLTEPAGVAALVQTAVDAFGKVNILVNNAAIRGNDALADVTLEKFQAIMRTNVEAPVLCAQAAAPHMAKAGWGRIVNIGGLSAHRGTKGRVHVAASKMAMVGVTRALSAELADDKITANIVVPGMIDTIRGASAGGVPHGGHPNLLDRDGLSAEVAHMVTTLCHPNAAYTTGQTIHVNGGGYLN